MPVPSPLVAVIGSINVDVVVRSRRMPRPGETLHGDSVALTLGGKGANQAAAAARLGSDVAFIACTGDDFFGDFARRELAAFGLCLDHVATLPGAMTGIATIAIDSSGENAITIVAGANAAVTVDTVAAADSLLARAAVLLLQCETPIGTSLRAARRLRESGGIVVLDPAPAPEGGLPAELLALCDVVTPNESEAAALTGIAVSDAESALAAAENLVARGARRTIVKLGGAGLVCADGDSRLFLPPFPVRAVDTVAAGDCFNAGLAHALARGEGFADALRFAAASGALAVTKPGAAAAAPTRPEVLDLLAAQG